jgi:hypothetical protein
MFLGSFGKPLFAADDGGGADGGDRRERARATDVHDRYNGDAMRIAEKLADAQNDNFDLRDKNRQLRGELDDAKKKLIPDGAVVLTGDDAKRWETYQKLGKPEDLEKALKERETATTQLTKLQRDAQVREAAGVEKLNADALLALPGLPSITIKDVKEGEAMVKRAFVTPEGGAETPLRDYGKQQYAALWSAVEATTQTQTQQQQAGGTVKVPPQSAGGGGETRSVGDLIKKRHPLPGQQKQQ